ncbi:hypothetical protein ABFT23_21700 [Nocardioides sp. C4-1]|uniref:hypothetical protein n=1 Tax=Nocardioides sp. C4-1 TaxID=3151851 RepID=UPI0032654B03
MSKLTLGLAFAAGYVVGAKAGRERYEQIRKSAAKVAENPRVQSATDAAKEKAGEVAAVAADVAREKAGEAVEAVKEKVSSQPEQPGGPLSTAP